MKIKKETLLSALKSVSLASTEKGILEQSSIICFDKNSVKGFNGEICIEAKIKTSIVGGVSAKEIVNLISKLEDGKIKIETENKILKIFSGRTVAKLKMEDVKFPEIKIPEENFWKSLPANFCEGINFCKASVPASEIIPELSQICVDGDKILSCDNLRATKFSLSKPIKEKILIPKNVCDILSQFDITHYFISEKWVHFKDSESILFSCVLPSSEYPSKKILSLFEKEGVEIKMPENFSKVIERVSSIVSGNTQDKLICLTFAKNEILCKGKSDSGYVREKVNSEYSGVEFSAYVNPNFLISALKEKCKVKISESFILIEGENFKNIISLQIKLDK